MDVDLRHVSSGNLGNWMENPGRLRLRGVIPEMLFCQIQRFQPSMFDGRKKVVFFWLLKEKYGAVFGKGFCLELWGLMFDHFA